MYVQAFLRNFDRFCIFVNNLLFLSHSDNCYRQFSKISHVLLSSIYVLYSIFDHRLSLVENQDPIVVEFQ